MGQGKETTENAALAVKEEHELSLMGIHGVTGVGIGEGETGEFFIKVYVEKLTPELKKQISPNLDGVKVEIEEIGGIVAF